MDTEQSKSRIVFTNKARCRDCYRCVRVCPVKAIRMENGQAHVEEDRCIACGTCIRECPQGAKTFRDDTSRARQIMAGGGSIAASVAPSFAAVFTEWERKRLPSALRKLGFSYVAETAIGAYHVAHKTSELVAANPTRSHVCTACPAAVTYVERYQPDLVGYLTPVCSPMVAHARHIKAELGPDTHVIFIGPCVAKKAEAERPENEAAVDCVLTFRELVQWLDQEGILLAECEESGFDEQPEGDARFFPLEGGSLRTASLDADLLATENVSVSGAEAVHEALESLRNDPAPVVIEPLFCPHGCVGGPAIPREANLYDRRREVLGYATRNPGVEPGEPAPEEALEAEFTDKPLVEEVEITEEKIREVLARTGKVTPEDELNCTACGYPTCRDKAIAVLRGLAEPEMCIPHMRRLAEQRTDRIIETSPNGILIVDEHMDILSMNPAFRRMFMCTEAVLGKRISYLMDPDPFERLASTGEDLLEMTVTHERYGIVCHQILYPLREEHQYVGIFVNVTRGVADRQKLDQLRAQTVNQAQQLLQHQITMAQQIGKFLGESAAQGEKLVQNLMKMAGEEHEPTGKEGDDWLADTYTSKS